MADYRNPTLVEILAEVRFAQALPSEKEAIAAVAQWTSAEVASAELVSRLVQDPERGVVEENWMRVRHGSKISQISKFGYAANLVGTYPGFADFLAHVERVSGDVNRIIGEPLPKSLKLQAIDRCTVPLHNFVLSRYFAAPNPWVPALVLQSSTDADANWGVGSLAVDGFNRSARMSVRRNAASEAVEITLDMVFQTRWNGEVPMASIVRDLHREALQAFEATISDSYREEIMGGRES